MPCQVLSFLQMLADIISTWQMPFKSFLKECKGIRKPQGCTILQAYPENVLHKLTRFLGFVAFGNLHNRVAFKCATMISSLDGDCDAGCSAVRCSAVHGNASCAHICLSKTASAE